VNPAVASNPKQIREAIKLINQLEKVTLQRLETLRELRSALKAKLEQLGG
jgi:hypothetical protein